MMPKKFPFKFLTLLLISSLLLLPCHIHAAPKKPHTNPKFTTTTSTASSSTTTTPTDSSSQTPEASTETPTVSNPDRKTVLGFTTYYYQGDSSSYNSMANNLSTVSEIATVTYTTDGYGNISGIVPTNQINLANSNGIKALAMVSNNFDGDIAKTLLENPSNRERLINNLLNAVKSNNYSGVNVDLEGVYYYDRSFYTTFVKELYSVFKPLGYTVSLSVPAKTYDSITNSWNGAFDYAALANYADQILIMTYDEHYPGGTPGPIASIGWVTNVINYASTVIPKSKLLLGVAAYGYDWSTAGTKAYSINGCNNLAAQYGSVIQWDSVSQSPYFTYTDANKVLHTVWFENSYSLAFKLNLVNSTGINGIGIWRLGLEDAAYWDKIKTKFGL